MKRRVLLIIGIVFGVLILGFASWFFFLNKTLQINNYFPKEEIEVFSEYTENGIDLCYGSLVSCQKLDYQTTGQVDTTHVGVYTVSYLYEYNGLVEEKVKEVHVLDKESPKITFEGVVNACPNGKLLGDNYDASDNYDGVLKDNVQVYLDENNETYLEVRDSSGNLTRVEADVLIGDTEKPKISLVDSKIYLLVGRTYQEPGFKAIDNCDGDLTKSVKVDSNVNVKKTGNYKITYSVTDSSNNTVSVTRDVVVIPKNKTIYPSKKTIYLTFDDGPGAYTGRLLNILDEYDVKATFFVTNQFQNNNYLNYIKVAHQKGHSIGVHSYTHNFNIYRSVDTYFADLNKMNAVIKRLTGEESKLVRFPGGSSNTISKKYKAGIMTILAKELENRGYAYFDWNLASGDSDGITTAKGVANNVIKKLNGETKMVLMHDIKSYSVDAVRDIIEYGLAHGYSFQAIDITSPKYHHRINN